MSEYLWFKQAVELSLKSSGRSMSSCRSPWQRMWLMLSSFVIICTIFYDARSMTMHLNMQSIYFFYVPESARSTNGFDAGPSSNSVTLNLRCPVILAF